MRVVLVGYVYDASCASMKQFFASYPLLVDIAVDLKKSGLDITIIHRFRENGRMFINGVDIICISDSFGPNLRLWQIPIHLHQAIRTFTPDIVHVHGLVFPTQTFALRLVLPQSTKLLVQHHAEQPWHGWRQFLQRWLLRGVNGFLFTTIHQGNEWLEKKIIRSGKLVHPVMEGSTTFKPKNKTAARQITQMAGNPIFLWVGRLDANKDPVTIVTGFERILVDYPLARLYMIYGSPLLLPALQKKVSENSKLANSIAFLGAIPHSRIESYFNSADYFVLGSHHEGSGYALAEALACGLVPIVPDFPSFRMMTENGSVGGLWRPGQVISFTKTALNVLQRNNLGEQQRHARKTFEKLLSYPAIGQRLAKIYGIISNRNQK